MKRYEVVLTVREHWSVFVEASDPRDARRRALRGEYDEAMAAMHGDRQSTGARASAAGDRWPER